MAYFTANPKKTNDTVTNRINYRLFKAIITLFIT